MRAAPVLVTLTLALAAQDARAGVAVSAEAGAKAAVPRISLQTSLTPLTGPGLGANSMPGLNASPAPGLATPVLAAPVPAAPSALTARALPAPLPVSAVVAAPHAGRPILAAASASDETKAEPEMAAAPAGKTERGTPSLTAEPGAASFKARILVLLKSLADPFGGKKAEEPPPASEAERLDREFAKLDLWGKVAPGARGEIEKARAARMSKAAFKEYAAAQAAESFERMKAARGTGNIGLHFNLHGGRREEYVGRGINATMGDIALRYSMSGDTNRKVYFFQTAEHHPFTALDASNGEILLFPTRMGHALNLFDLESPELKAAIADGRVKNFGAISMDFHGMNGVPYSSYLAPPVEVFIGTARKLGLKRLTRDEETLATVRYLEAVVLAGGAYVPGR